jgi:hypothetical protein
MHGYGNARNRDPQRPAPCRRSRFHALAQRRAERAARVARLTVQVNSPVHSTARTLAATIVDLSAAIVRVDATTPTLALTGQTMGPIRTPQRNSRGSLRS